MDLWGIVKAGWKAAIVGAVVGAAVYGLRYAMWPKAVPNAVSKLRWPIGLTVGIILIAVEIGIGFDASGTAINAGVAVVVAESLRNNPKPSSSSP